MKKKSLLYVSPFWPIRSGISEYSESLIWELKKYFDVSLLIDGYRIHNEQIRKEFKVLRFNKGMSLLHYDYIIYNFGNNPEAHNYMYDLALDNPGYIIMHDLSLYYLSVVHYREKDLLYQKIYEMEGPLGLSKIKDSLKWSAKKDLLQHKELSSNIRLNKEIIENAKGIFVHSEYSRNEIKKIAYKCPVYKIDLINCMPNVEGLISNYLRNKYKLTSQDFIVSSPGFIASTKQNDLCCRAIKLYNKTHKEKIHYFMIGSGDFADEFLDTYIHKTGFLNNREFFSAVDSSDLILNLRKEEEYNGESSATLLQCMFMKKTCIVTNMGWFSELPNDCVIKIEPRLREQELMNVIEKCKEIKDSRITEKAYQFAGKRCSSENVAYEIYNILTKRAKEIG